MKSEKEKEYIRASNYSGIINAIGLVLVIGALLWGYYLLFTINKKLEEFTNKYVLCKECKKPDTHIEELGHGLKQLICEACGARNSLR